MPKKKKKRDIEEKKKRVIQSRQDKQKYEFVQYLKRNPNIEMASQKTGVHRSTIYRWVAEDEDFKEAIDLAMKEGVAVMNDIMESLLIKAARDYKVGAIKYWLQNRHPAYINLRVLEKIIESFTASNGPKPLSGEQKDQIDRVLKLWGFLDEDNDPIARIKKK